MEYRAQPEEAVVAETRSPEPLSGRDVAGPALTPAVPGGGFGEVLRFLRRSWPAAALCAILIAGTGLYTLAPAYDPEPAAAEMEALAANLATLETHGLDAPVVSADEREEALATMGLDEAGVQEIKRQVVEDGLELVWITLWDNQAEDGDVVRIESDYFRTDVPILHGMTRFAVPRPSSGVVNVRGVVDGGGGVTLALMVDGTPLPLPPLGVGQALGIKVR